MSAVPSCQSQTRDNSAGLAKVLYYSGSQGVFTMNPPPAGISYYLPLRGTCKLPEFVIQIRKKNTGLPTRQASYRMGAGTDFNINYKLAHQNSDGKRYVITSTVDLNGMITGKYWIYRPVAGFIK